jgi:hypothetical protein
VIFFELFKEYGTYGLNSVAEQNHTDAAPGRQNYAAQARLLTFGSYSAKFKFSNFNGAPVQAREIMRLLATSATASALQHWV